MSLHNISSERVCYVHCNFCNTVLAVSVPCSSNMVTVRCGRCTNLLSLTIAPNLHQIITTPPPPPPPPPRPVPPPLFQNLHHHKQNMYNFQEIHCEGSQHSKSGNMKASGLDSQEIHEHPRSSLSMHHPMGIKKQRAPSAYNRFIKEEIRRIKTNNPDISHREAFSTAAKNWAHLPHTHFGLTLNATASSRHGT